MKNDLTIACFLWGTWCAPHGVGYVRRLRAAIKRYLPYPHRFVCFTDVANYDFGPDIEPISISHLPNWSWNLRKMFIYNKSNGLKGRVLLFDLDVVITGDLSDIVSYDGEFATCMGAFSKNGKKKVGGSLVSFPAGRWHYQLWAPIAIDDGHLETVTKGSERKYFELMLCKCQIDFWQDLFPGQVLSYKADCRRGALPLNARIVRFHGKPRPHEAKNGWVKEHWKTIQY